VAWQFPEDPIAAVGRVAHRQSQRACFATELRARLSMRGIRFTMIFTHSRISHAAKWQIVNSRLKHAFVEHSISRGCRVHGLFTKILILGEQIQTERTRLSIDEINYILNAAWLRDRQNWAQDFLPALQVSPKTR
jgi:hypothetical protein